MARCTSGAKCGNIAVEELKLRVLEALVKPRGHKNERDGKRASGDLVGNAWI